MSLPSLAPADYGFPDPKAARLDADGLLAIGGDLHPARLLAAYANGIFPWFNSDKDQILWWCPDPRGVLPPQAFKPTRSLRKTLRNRGFQFTADRAFEKVIRACAETPRADQNGTWITQNMQAAYIALYELGFAHSIEVWLEGKLVGGLYGLSLGRMFFGESMFSRHSEASKSAFAVLCEQLSAWDFELLDCQMMNPHLASLGVRELDRSQFLEQLQSNDLGATRRGQWQLDTPTANSTSCAPETVQTAVPDSEPSTHG